MGRRPNLEAQSRKSGRRGKIVGVLDIGDDIGRLPQRIGRDRLQTDGPVVALAGAGHADDVEFHAAAQRVALERVADPGPDLLEGCRGLCKKCLEIYVPSPSTAGLQRGTPHARGNGAGDDCCGENG